MRRQFYRVGVSSVPYAAARAVGWEFRGWEPLDAALAPTVWGRAAAGAALGALALALFAFALLGARRLLGARLGKRVAVAAAALAAPIFALSVFYAGHVTEGAHEAERQRAEMADFDAIREMARGKPSERF